MFTWDSFTSAAGNFIDSIGSGFASMVDGLGSFIGFDNAFDSLTGGYFSGDSGYTGSSVSGSADDDMGGGLLSSMIGLDEKVDSQDLGGGIGPNSGEGMQVDADQMADPKIDTGTETATPDSPGIAGMDTNQLIASGLLGAYTSYEKRKQRDFEKKMQQERYGLAGGLKEQEFALKEKERKDRSRAMYGGMENPIKAPNWK